MLGKTISHYRIFDKLGEGGMGVVYKAEDTKLGRSVALKFLPPELTRDTEARKRFAQEARAASALDHPNICTIHEIDETAEGQLFIAMAFYEGESLKAKIERGPLKLDEALDIAAQIAQGLAKAHEQGIVHRDIKPANILVTKDGLVKIVDFGLAKLAGAKVTKTGTTLGTARYMSPEQARGEAVDARSDIFSLGAVLYEMLTGKHAFPGEYEQAMLYAIMNEEPEPVTALRTGVPMELERIVATCMAKNPGERYQHVDEIIADLRRMKAIADAPVSKRPTEIRMGMSRRPVRWWPWVVGLCAAAAVVIGVLSRHRSPSSTTPGSERKMLAVLPFVNLGPPEDEYFAAGITEEITSRLATIRELGVISRTSAFHYAGTSKTIKQIGSELGVAYILEGTVRWAREPGGISKVRITPQLIRVSDDTHLWSAPYDRVIQDIFEIQSNIAQNVVEHLGLTLLQEGHPAFERRPTNNLEAYQAYLRAEYFAGQPHFVAKYWEEAANNYRQAVELDSGFALAYAKLSIAHARLYYYRYDMSEERRNMAKIAVDRAFELDPNNPEIHLALGYFHLFVERDIESALMEFDIAARDLPDNADVLEAKGDGFRQEGRWKEAVDQYGKACELDPRSASRRENLAETFWWTRRYPEALDAADKAIDLAPDQMWPYLDKAFNYWSWKGKDALREARETLTAMGPGEDPGWVVWAWFYQAAYEGNYREAIGYLTAFPDEWIRIKIGASPTSLLVAQIREPMGEPRRAGKDYEHAKDLLEEEVRAHPDDPRYHSSLGIAYAALGRGAEAVREGKRAVDLLPTSKDAVYGIPYVVDLAQIYTILGEQDAALNEIERLLSQSSWISPAFLEMDFRWDRLRDNPRFKRLLERYSKTES
jgi:serine/threonine protein kinase/tetratricopeptide (TPR) repeat protein